MRSNALISLKRPQFHRPFFLDLKGKLEGGDGENSNGKWGGSDLPESISTISFIDGRLLGARCKQRRAMVMHNVASSLSNDCILESTRSKSFPFKANCLAHDIRLALSNSDMGEAVTCKGLLPDTTTNTSTPKL